jgi:hypothetical protein
VAERRRGRVVDRLRKRQHLGAVGRPPTEAAPDSLALVAQAAREDERLEPEAAQHLRELGGVAEAVGEVPDVGRRGAVPRAHGPAVEQVAHERLAAHQELVRQHVARARLHAAAREQGAQALLHVGPDLEVVLEQDGLAVEREAELGTGLHGLDQLVHDLGQPDAEVLERQVPLAVPVRVGHDPEAPAPGIEQGGGGHGGARDSIQAWTL